MRYRRLGRTNLTVSEISLGTVELGMNYGAPGATDSARPEESQAARLLERALELGINLIDTARLYGESEAIIGRALQARRAGFILASKTSSFQKEGLSGDALRESVTDSVRQSLAALRTDFIDVMLIHCGGAETRVSREVLEILDDLRRAGTLRWIGASVYGPEAARDAIDCGLCDCVQLAYSPADRRPESGVLEAARRAGVGIVARSVLLKGVLTQRYRELPPGLSALAEWAAGLESAVRREVDNLPELAYRYVLSADPPATALAGTSRIEELEEILTFADRGPLPDRLLAQVRSIGPPEERLLSPGNWVGS